eukprot:6579209-Pyramimonas_sp.AAC.4
MVTATLREARGTRTHCMRGARCPRESCTFGRFEAHTDALGNRLQHLLPLLAALPRALRGAQPRRDQNRAPGAPRRHGHELRRPGGRSRRHGGFLEGPPRPALRARGGEPGGSGRADATAADAQGERDHVLQRPPRTERRVARGCRWVEKCSHAQILSVLIYRNCQKITSI